MCVKGLCTDMRYRLLLLLDASLLSSSEANHSFVSAPWIPALPAGSRRYIASDLHM